jgi:hypothetical protein
MDIRSLKGRIAEAFVEGILRRAGYQVALVGRESRVQHLLKVGRDQFLPDFLAWKPVGELDSASPPCRLVGIEVKYRRDIRDYLRHGFAGEWTDSIAQWPELYFVVVTDQPETGRSCFQAFRPRPPAAGAEVVATDLHEVPELDVYRRNVEEHENLVRVIFPLLGSSRPDNDVRKPPAKATSSPSPLRLAR